MYFLMEDSFMEEFETKVNSILYCNVAPMDKYQGFEEGALLNGGKYIQKNGVGFELYNFQELQRTYIW